MPSTITIAKLQRMLYTIDSPVGVLRATPDNELALSFNGQLDYVSHEYLLKHSFVFENGCYVYRTRATQRRPRERKEKVAPATNDEREGFSRSPPKRSQKPKPQSRSRPRA